MIKLTLMNGKETRVVECVESNTCTMDLDTTPFRSLFPEADAAITEGYGVGLADVRQTTPEGVVHEFTAFMKVLKADWQGECWVSFTDAVLSLPEVTPRFLY